MSPLKDSTFQEIYGQDSGETQKIKNDSDSDDGDNRIFFSGQNIIDFVYVGTVDSVKAEVVIRRYIYN